MGLIYVNPEGPDGNPDPIAAANDIRDTFGRMAMNDEETVALIAGGHTFGKTHGAGPATNVGRRTRSRRPRGAGPRLDEQLRHRQGRRHHHQRPGSHLDHHADQVEQQLLREPVRLRMGADARARPARNSGSPRAPARPFRTRTTRRRSCVPTMLTTDLSLRFDPAYEKISRRFMENPDQFADAFARAWFKLTHRDMGPRARYLGPEVPAEELIWQDPIPRGQSSAGRRAGHRGAGKSKVLASGLTVGAAGLDRLGVGLHLPWLRQARRRQRRPHSPGAAEGLGRQPARAAGQGAAGAGRHPQRVQRGADGRQEDLAGRPDRAGRRRGRGAGGARRRPRGAGSLHAGAHGCARRSRPTSSRSRRWSRSPTASATTSRPGWPCRPRRC